jgi:predicted HTH domain antitoxin
MKSAEEIFKKYELDAYCYGSIKADILSAMEQYANQSRTQLTDEELEKEAERLYPFVSEDRVDSYKNIQVRIVIAQRAAHIKARKMGSGGWVSVEDRLPEVINKVMKPVFGYTDKGFTEKVVYFPHHFKTIEFEDWDDYNEEDFPETEDDKEKGIVWLRAGWYIERECSRCDTLNWDSINITHWQPLPSPPIKQK